jgi:hypothetical protein
VLEYSRFGSFIWLAGCRGFFAAGTTPSDAGVGRRAAADLLFSIRRRNGLLFAKAHYSLNSSTLMMVTGSEEVFSAQ